ncbi:hypothetical protein F4810DRAFT_713149 [Camillea tinctor]|nr:hypothetical protein F4810DRAFT_713149 [Camillea tinctor]
MVYIPDLPILSNLRNFSSIDNQKFELICDVLPRIKYSSEPLRSLSIATQGSWVSGHYGASEETIPASSSQTLRRQASPRRRNTISLTFYGYESKLVNPHLALNQNTLQGRYSSKVVHCKETSSLKAVSRREDASRISPDTQPPGDSKSRKRKERPKDQRNRLERISKIHKSGRKLLSNGPKMEEPNVDDTIAEGKERRQKERIRAMWTADRQETARLVSATKIQAEDTILIPRPEVEKDYERSIRHSPLLTFMARTQLPPPALAKEHEEVDRMASLESEPNQ